MQTQAVRLATDHGKVFYLTTESGAACHGLPVLQIKTRDRARAVTCAYPDGEYGPADITAPGVTAAAIVAAWARRPGRTPEELQAAQSYLSQWPDGPQV
jgi:hypothetical protein